MSRCTVCSGERNLSCIVGCPFALNELHEHIYIYLRTSGTKSRKARAERRQLARIEKKLGPRAGMVRGVFGDHALSVKNPVWQQGLEALFAAVSADPHTNKRIVTQDVRRVTRNRQQGAEYYLRAESQNAAFETLRGVYSLNRSGKKRWNDAVYQAWKDNQKRAAGNKRSHARSAQKGEWRSIAWPGYIIVDGTPQIDGESRRDMELLYESALDGFSIRFIASTISQQMKWLLGHRSHREATREKAVLNILQDVKNAGKRRPTDRSPCAVYQGNWEPFISLRQFEQILLMYPTDEQKKHQQAEEFPLDGWLICGHCQRTLKPSSVYFYDPETGEVLCDRKVYICPPRRMQRSPSSKFDTRKICSPRRQYEADDLHAQIEPLLAQMAGRRGRPRDLVAQWQNAQPHARADLIKLAFKQRRPVVDGRIVPPVWAAN